MNTRGFLSLVIAVGALCPTSQTSFAQQTWDPVDTDSDGLPDAWEIAYFGGLGRDGTDDSDGDTVPALKEFQMGLNPTLAKTDGVTNDWEGLEGFLRCERWNGIPGRNLSDLFAASAFKNAPLARLITEARVPSNVGDSYGIRIRGTLRAPVSGQYRFYISSDNQGELWLGTSADRFSRRKVASVSDHTNPLDWTQYGEQASKVVTLEAGQHYWIEALMKEELVDDHLAIGWLRPGETAIEVIPGVMPNGTPVLHTPVIPPDDVDDDGLPDAWESTVGLSPGDNGRINGADGGYSDWDGDGLTNFEEWLTGGNPLAPGGNVGIVRRDMWTGIPGDSVADLTGNANFSRPAASTTLEQPESLSFASIGDDYGQRLTGCIVPPHSGNWRFWIASDNGSEFWLSSDASRLHKSKVAFASTVTGPENYDATPSQRSVTVPLVGGRPYYYEVLHKEGWWADYVSVAWAYEPINWALASRGATASQSSTGFSGSAPRAIDGNTSGFYASNSITHTNDEANSWWEVDLHAVRPVSRVVLWNRTDPGAESRLSNFRITVTKADGSELFQDFFQPGQGNAGASFAWDIGSVVEATKIRISLNGYNNAGNGYLSLSEVQAFDWKPEGDRQAIPASALRSPYAEPLDLDGDSLPDAWESQFGLSATDNGSTLAANGEYGDPDGDGVPNLLEYKNGTAPLTPNGESGKLARETWYRLSGSSIYDLVHAPAFLQPADVRDTTSAWSMTERGDYYGERLRGTVKAPETGWYTFWITGDNECQLSLSSDSRKFRKRVIASVGDGHFMFAPIATGNGALDSSFDQLPSQKSESVYLTAGSEYFIEVLHADDNGPDHVAVAWKTPSSARSLLPFGVLRSFVYDIDDVDDDDLPDSWESQYSLDPSDNGSGQTGLEGALGDKDGDGLTNRDEYLLGTNPNDADSDHDGLSDFSEVNGLGSDPTKAGSGVGTVIAELAGTAGTSTAGQWLAGPNGTLLSLERRGSCTWPFTLASSGIKLLEVLAMAQGNTWAGDRLAIDLAVIRPSDSKRWKVGSYPIYDNYGAPCQVLAILPQLAAGSYLAEITVRNVSESRNVRIDRIRLLDAAGADENGNGIIDWLETRVAQSNGVLTGAASAVSPACIEGVARDTSLSWLMNGTSQVPLTSGVDDRWFANVALPSDGSAAPVSAFFEDGSFTMEAPVSWTSTNALAGGPITVRTGDSLRLTAYPGTMPDSGAVSITGAGEAISTTADAPVVRGFEIKNWALASNGATATQSDTAFGGDASRAIDGNTDGAYLNRSITHTDNNQNSWWQVDFGKTREVAHVVLWNRTDAECISRLSNYRISVRDEADIEIVGQNFYTGSGFVDGNLTWTLPQAVQARRIRITLLGLNNQGNGYLSLAEVQALPSTFTNWALASNGATATQSDTGWGGDASRAIDGNTDGAYNNGSVTHTYDNQNSWWQVDLGQAREVAHVVLWNRTDPGAPPRLSNYRISVRDEADSEIVGQNFYTGSGFVDGYLAWTLPQAVHARRIRISLLGLNNAGNGYLSLAEVQVLPSNLTNWALASNGARATQSDTAFGAEASRAIDGNTDGAYNNGSVTHTYGNQNAWWQVDFGQTREVAHVVLWNRTDPECPPRLSNYRISVLDDTDSEIVGQNFYTGSGFVNGNLTWTLPQAVQAHRIRVSLLGFNNQGNGYLSLAEVQAFPRNNVITLNATHKDSANVVTTGSLNVNIVSADFGADFSVRTGRWRDWFLPGVKSGLPLEFDSRLSVAALESSDGCHKLRVATDSDEPVHVIARSAVASTVAAVGTVDPHLIGDPYDTGYVELLETLPDGVLHGRVSVVADRLPPGGYVQIQIWAGGAQFANGSTLLNLTAAAFGPNGVAYVDVYYPSQASISSFCAYYRLYDGNGNLLSGY